MSKNCTRRQQKTPLWIVAQAEQTNPSSNQHLHIKGRAIGRDEVQHAIGSQLQAVKIGKGLALKVRFDEVAAAVPEGAIGGAHAFSSEGRGHSIIHADGL
jgi:hypothetical protein